MKNDPLMDVYKYGFALIDTALFLDTHPHDQAALEYYEIVRDNYAQAVRVYEENVGPLTKGGVNVNDGWTWVKTPWPWEGGAC